MSHLRLFNVGDLVDVAPSNKSSGGKGWITAIVDADDGIGDTMVVKYVVQRKVSKEVKPDRLSLANIETTARRRSQDGGDLVPLPSILSQSYQPAKQIRQAMADASNIPSKKVRRSNRMLLTEDLLRMPVDEMYDYLDKHKHNIGWLRRAEAEGSGSRVFPHFTNKSVKYHCKQCSNGKCGT